MLKICLCCEIHFFMMIRSFRFCFRVKRKGGIFVHRIWIRAAGKHPCLGVQMFSGKSSG